MKFGLDECMQTSKNNCYIPMQSGKFHLKKKSRLIAFHSSGEDGALTNSLVSTAHITSHVSFIAEQTATRLCIYAYIYSNLMCNVHLEVSTCQISKSEGKHFRWCHLCSHTALIFLALKKWANLLYYNNACIVF